ncbi:MAG: hypothetical protein ACLPOA_06760 [Methylocella sp.]
MAVRSFEQATASKLGQYVERITSGEAVNQHVIIAVCDRKRWILIPMSSPVRRDRAAAQVAASVRNTM